MYTLDYHSETALSLCGFQGNWYNHILKIDLNVYVISVILFLLCDIIYYISCYPKLIISISHTRALTLMPRILTGPNMIY